MKYKPVSFECPSCGNRGFIDQIGTDDDKIYYCNICQEKWRDE